MHFRIVRVGWDSPHPHLPPPLWGEAPGHHQQHHTCWASPQGPPLPENLPELLEATHQPTSDTAPHYPDIYSLPSPCQISTSPSGLNLDVTSFQEHSLVQPPLCSHRPRPRGFCGGGGGGGQVTPPRLASCPHRTVTLRAEADLASSPMLDKHQK